MASQNSTEKLSSATIDEKTPQSQYDQTQGSTVPLDSELKELESIEAQVLSKLLGLSTSNGVPTAVGEQDLEALDTMPDVANLLKGLTQSEGLATDMETKLDAILAKLDGLIDSLEVEGAGDAGKWPSQGGMKDETPETSGEGGKP